MSVDVKSLITSFLNSGIPLESKMACSSAYSWMNWRIPKIILKVRAWFGYVVASAAMFYSWYPIIQKMLLNCMYSVPTNPMQECKSVCAHMVVFCMHSILVFCRFASLWQLCCSTSLSSQMIEAKDPNNNMSSCSWDSKKFWVLRSIEQALPWKQSTCSQATQGIQWYL